MKASPIGGPQYRPTQPPSESDASVGNPATAAPRTSARQNQFPGLPSLPQRVDGPPRQPPAMTGGQIGGASEPLLRPTTAQPPCNVFMLSVQALNWLQTPANGHNGPDARKLAVAVLSAMTHGLLLPMQNPLQPAAIVFEARGLIDGVQGALRVRLAETQEGLNLLDIAFRPLGAMRPSMHVSMQPSQPATSMTAPPAGRALGTADASQTGSMQSLDRQHPDTSSTVSRPASEFSATGAVRTARPGTRSAPYPAQLSLSSSSTLGSQARAADMRSPVAPRPPRASFQPTPPPVPAQVRDEPDPASSSLASGPSTAPPHTGFVANRRNGTMAMDHVAQETNKTKTYTVTQEQYNAIVRLGQQNANPTLPRKQRLSKLDIAKQAGRGVDVMCVSLVLASANVSFLSRHFLTVAERLDIGRRFTENQTLSSDSFCVQEDISDSTLTSARAAYQAYLEDVSQRDHERAAGE